MNWSVEHTMVETNPGNSGNGLSPVGIGHLAAFDKYLFVNNIDHNSEISRLEQSLLNPAAIYNQTVYPHDLENAGFDLDIHAVFYDKERQSLLMLNHFGRLQFFDISSLSSTNGISQLKSFAEVSWVGDVEQTLLVSDCLISTSPGDYHVPGPAKPGLFVSSPLSSVNMIQKEQKLDYTVCFAEKGNASAVAVNSIENRLAVAFRRNILLVEMTKQTKEGVSLNGIAGLLTVNFNCQYLSFWADKYLICAGHDIVFEDNVYDPSNLTGGGLVIVDIENNEILTHVQFNCDLAWGNGGQCLTVFDPASISSLSTKGPGIEICIVGVDRQANLWAWNWHSRKTRAQTLTPGSLICKVPANGNSGYGIAHLVNMGSQLFCGFNRDGARLHRYNFVAL